MDSHYETFHRNTCIIGRGHCKGCCVEKYIFTSARKKIPEDKIFLEVQRFENALKNAEKDILETQKEVSSTIGEKYAEIFAVHLMFLKDKHLKEQTIRNIKTEQIDAANAFHKTIESLLTLFGKSDKDLTKDRRRDLLDVAERVFSYLREGEEKKIL